VVCNTRVRLLHVAAVSAPAANVSIAGCLRCRCPLTPKGKRQVNAAHTLGNLTFDWFLALVFASQLVYCQQPKSKGKRKASGGGGGKGKKRRSSGFRSLLDEEAAEVSSH
jgi:hypothetical protein